MRYWLAAIAVVWCAVLLYFFPVLRSYPSAVLPSRYPDALEFVWTSWRIEGVLDGTRELYRTNELFWPDGASLLLHTVCEGVLLPAGLIAPGLSPVWRFNSACLVLMLLNGVSALSLFRRLQVPLLAALLGSLLLTFHPFVLGHLSAGHLNFLALFPLIEVVRWQVVRLDDGTFRRRDTGRVLLSIALLPFVNLYYLYFAASILGLFSAVRFFDRTRRTRTIVHDWLLFILGIFPAAWHIARVAGLARSDTYTRDHDPLRHSADLLSYVMPSESLVLATLPLIQDARALIHLHAGESSLYLGLAVIGAIILGLVFGRRTKLDVGLGFVGCGALFLSFGPVLTVGGTPLLPTGYDQALRAVLPFYPSVPARFSVIAFITLLPVAIRAVWARPTWFRWMWSAIVLVEFFPRSIEPFFIGGGEEVLEEVRRSADIRAVLDASSVSQRAMLHQTYHQKPIAGGFLSRRPRKLERSYKRNDFIRWLRSEIPFGVGARYGWCGLQVDALIVDSTNEQLVRKISESALFHQTRSDGTVQVYMPSASLCGGSG